MPRDKEYAKNIIRLFEDRVLAQWDLTDSAFLEVRAVSSHQEK